MNHDPWRIYSWLWEDSWYFYVAPLLGYIGLFCLLYVFLEWYVYTPANKVRILALTFNFKYYQILL